ncbi:MAG: rhomboid family intramembrane serine protease [Proteobacteria bacterium]|nr:rhomboid family intramembrane serine protease [Pseudomonadota bacterium]
MSDDLRVVFESRNRAACSDRALVLASSQIPHTVVDDSSSCALVVPAEYSARAMDELRLYDEENPPPMPLPRKIIEYQDPVPGVVAYLIVVSLIAWLAGNSAFGSDWYQLGRVDGTLLRQGEWWRPVTALTLHSGLRHLVGNILFGTLFGLFAGRLLGSGLAWFAIVVSGAMGNVLNTLLLESSHRSIGASTAVFAALGLVAGYVWRAKLMSQERWPYRVGPVVGGLALLMYTGTGDANTDVGAHLMGFLCGFASGMLLTLSALRPGDVRWQRLGGAATLVLVGGAWLVALLR